MTHAAFVQNEETPARPEALIQAARDRWASPLAAMFVMVHFIGGVFLFGWFYWIVPRIKWQVDQTGIPPTASVLLQIYQSDLIVNYWYVPAFFGIPFLIIDFLTIRWIAKQIGRSKACAVGLSLLLLILANFGYSYLVLKAEIARLNERWSTVN
jgi:uncharacterized protein YqgC (DUF456 family)